MSVVAVTAIMIGGMLVAFATGMPIAFALGGVAMAVGFLLWGPQSFGAVAQAAYGSMSAFLYVAIPLFILMGNVLERSGVADRMYETIHRWAGPIHGGLAIGTVLICTAVAAMVGMIGAGLLTMGVIAMPVMLKYKYDRRLVMGSIMCGGGLGILIPPSIPMLIFCQIARQSVARMFAAGMVPGVILALIYMSYIGIRCAIRPELGPALPPEDRASWGEKFASLRGVILPIFLVLSVLGSIFGGLATPTEAAAVGAFGAVICAAIHRRLNWTMLREALTRTLSLAGLIMWIVVGASTFQRIFLALGGIHLLEEVLAGGEVNPWLVLIGMQFTLIVLGMVLDDYAIILIAAPIYTPVVVAMGFNPIWFGVLLILNLQIAVLTPPYGFAVFYMRSLVPQDVPMSEIWHSIIPFIPLIIIVMAIVMLFPQLALWLPDIVMG